jgi:hypothetical protein
MLARDVGMAKDPKRSLLREDKASNATASKSNHLNISARLLVRAPDFTIQRQ